MHFAPFYPALYRTLQPVFPGCLWAGSPCRKTIALSFDDGPHPQFTPPLLKVLEEYAVKASFFCLGKQVNRFPQLTKAIAQQGHWLGIHGYEHHSFPLLTPVALKQSLQATQTAIAQACQLDPATISDVRPPNGLFTPQTLNLLHQWQYRPVMWSVVPEDWLRPGIAVVVRRVLQQVQNGSLIVLHDGCNGGQDVAYITRALLSHLVAQGYQFVTINNLWNQKNGLSVAA